MARSGFVSFFKLMLYGAVFTFPIGCSAISILISAPLTLARKLKAIANSRVQAHPNKPPSIVAAQQTVHFLDVIRVSCEYILLKLVRGGKDE